MLKEIQMLGDNIRSKKQTEQEIAATHRDARRTMQYRLETTGVAPDGIADLYASSNDPEADFEKDQNECRRSISHHEHVAKFRDASEKRTKAWAKKRELIPAIEAAQHRLNVVDHHERPKHALTREYLWELRAAQSAVQELRDDLQITEQDISLAERHMNVAQRAADELECQCDPTSTLDAPLNFVVVPGPSEPRPKLADAVRRGETV